jgi:hypothetical protein
MGNAKARVSISCTAPKIRTGRLNEDSDNTSSPDLRPKREIEYKLS